MKCLQFAKRLEIPLFFSKVDEYNHYNNTCESFQRESDRRFKFVMLIVEPVVLVRLRGLPSVYKTKQARLISADENAAKVVRIFVNILCELRTWVLFRF